MSLTDVLKKSFDIANGSYKKHTYLTVIIFSYYIDDINSKFVINAFIVKYPLQYESNYEVDKDALSINSIEI
jgi:hypothetical protein